MRQTLNQSSMVLLAGMLISVVPSLLARFAMRLVALALGAEPSFTLGGTIGIVIIGAFLGGTMGIIYFAVRPALPPQASALTKGFLFGLFLFVVFAGPFYLLNDEVIAQTLNSPAGRGLFFVLPFIFGLGVAYLVEYLEKHWFMLRERVTLPEATRALFVFGVFALSIFLLTTVFSQFLANVAELVGIPIRRWQNGRDLLISNPLQTLSAGLLILSYPLFLLKLIYSKLQPYLRGARWLQGLLYGGGVALVLGIGAYSNIQLMHSSMVLRRAPLAGLNLLLPLLLLYGMVAVFFPMYQKTSTGEQRWHWAFQSLGVMVGVTEILCLVFRLF